MRNNNTGMVLVIIVVIVFAVLLLGGARMMRYSGFGMDSGMMSGIVTTIAPTYLALIIIGAGVGSILLLLAHEPKHAVAATSNSALDISKARYAKDGITKEQFITACEHDLLINPTLSWRFVQWKE